MMRRLQWCLLLALGWCSMAWSQDAAVAGVDRFEAERQRIEAVRSQKLAELEVEDEACLSKFAVASCQEAVAARRRKMLAELKRQEIKVNAAQHRQKGAEQLQHNAEKAAEHAAHEAELQDKPDRKTQEDRQKEQDSKVLDHKNQAQPRTAAPTKKSTSALDAPQIEKSREAYADKLNELEKRRQERDKNLKEKTSPSAPLPVPP